MNKQDTLRPLDLVVALTLAVQEDAPRKTFARLGADLGVSQSSVHAAVKRLGASGLLRAGTREPNRHALMSFLAHGARYAFPPGVGKEMRGIPTAYSGPVLEQVFDYTLPMVWPHPSGPVRGAALSPLYPQATSLPERSPDVYRALTLVDAIRVGRARERKAALEALGTMLSHDQAVGV